MAFYGIIGNVGENDITSTYKINGTGTSARVTYDFNQVILGGAYSVNDKLSLSAGLKKVFAYNTLLFKNDKLVILNKDENGRSNGWGYQLGLNYQFNDKVNLGIKYNSKVKLIYKNTSKIFGFMMNGRDSERDLPAVLTVGLSGKVNDKLNLSSSVAYYFNKNANIDDAANQNQKIYNNGYELAFGAEYKLNPKITLLGSTSYSNTGAKVIKSSEFPLNGFGLGAGVKYNFDENTEFVVGLSHYFFKEQNANFGDKYYAKPKEIKSGKVTYDKNLTQVGVSVTKKF